MIICCDFIKAIKALEIFYSAATKFKEYQLMSKNFEDGLRIELDIDRQIKKIDRQQREKDRLNYWEKMIKPKNSPEQNFTYFFLISLIDRQIDPNKMRIKAISYLHQKKMLIWH